MAAATGGTDGIRIVPFAEPVPARMIGMAWRRNSSRQGDCQTLAGFLAAFSSGSGRSEVNGQPDPQQGEKRKPAPEAVVPVA
jgi:LysR family hydrogen peroxide-inducible transcriptional activator